MGRSFAYFLMVLGVYFFASAAYDEYRGMAAASSPGRTGQRYVVNREEDPKQFRGLMTYEWGRAIIVTIGGYVVLGICRRADESDPTSPNFGGKSSITDLERTLAEEENRRRGWPED